MQGGSTDGGLPLEDGQAAWSYWTIPSISTIYANARVLNTTYADARVLNTIFADAQVISMISGNRPEYESSPTAWAAGRGWICNKHGGEIFTAKSSSP